MRSLTKRQQQPTLLIASRIQRQLLVPGPYLELLPLETQLPYRTPQKRRRRVVVGTDPETARTHGQQQRARRRLVLAGPQPEHVSVDRVLVLSKTRVGYVLGARLGSDQAAVTTMRRLHRMECRRAPHARRYVVLGPVGRARHVVS